MVQTEEGVWAAEPDERAQDPTSSATKTLSVDVTFGIGSPGERSPCVWCTT
jgi:hypothetical protein